MPLTQQAPSWDDAPISNGDFWQKIYSLNKWKYWKVGAAVAGLCLLAVVVLGIVSSRRGRQLGDENVTAVPSGTSAESTTPAPVASPASKDPKAANPGTDGKSVYTDNLVPPPDSYVD